MDQQALFENVPFWSGSVNLLDGKIEEVHSYQEAQVADFHHSLYFSHPQIYKMSKGECAFFWINNNGAIEGLWRDEINDEIIKKIAEQLIFHEKNKEEQEGYFVSKHLYSFCLRRMGRYRQYAYIRRYHR